MYDDTGKVTETAPAYLTPAIGAQARGAVHSVFGRAANVLFSLPGGDRLVTLADPALGGLPDSVRLPRAEIRRLAPGMPAALSGERLALGDRMYPLRRLGAEPFLLRRLGRPRQADAFFALTEEMRTGFSLIPPQRRRSALWALCTENAVMYLGLGPGLTPGFDDACVGAMAVFRAAGEEAPFRFSDLSVTTLVSARYLTLASEGYFGEAVLRVIGALFGDGPLKEPVEALKAAGATSGCDMLLGMRKALRALG